MIGMQYINFRIEAKRRKERESLLRSAIKEVMFKLL